jgi:hypothetical protein
MQRKKWPPCQLGKAEAQLISKKRELEQKGERCFREGEVGFRERNH